MSIQMEDNWVTKKRTTPNVWGNFRIYFSHISLVRDVFYVYQCLYLKNYVTVSKLCVGTSCMYLGFHT